jgi:hypothetical protein
MPQFPPIFLSNLIAAFIELIRILVSVVFATQKTKLLSSILLLSLSD